jgi:hypothetical protein
MAAATILRRARASRWATAASEATRARAIWAVVKPQTARRVGASCAWRDSAGWQQVNISRSRSSGCGDGCQLWSCASLSR